MADLETVVQSERAFQKQRIFKVNKDLIVKAVSKTDRAKRWHKNVGLGFRTPREAIHGTYIDKKCPFTGDVNIRGRILKGVVRKMKMHRTIVIRRDYMHYVGKYKRYERRHKNMSVHCSPSFRDCAVGDIVTVGECRPLSKTVRFNVLKVTKPGGTAKKAFSKF